MMRRRACAARSAGAMGGEAMNKEQLTALTPPERQLAEAAQLDPGKVFAGEDVLPVLAALADAHLEVQEAKDSRDGFACDLDHAESEVARLKEERDEAMAELVRFKE